MSHAKNEAYNEMSKREYAVSDAISELKKAKEVYRVDLIKNTIGHIMKVVKDEGTINERDLEIFLNDLSINTKHIFYK